MIIRTATPNDLDEISRLEVKCFPPSEAESREVFSDRLKYYPAHFWLMFDGGKLVSFIDGLSTDERNFSDEMFSHCELHDESGQWQIIIGVNTHPDYRGKGCAGKLLRCVIRDSREHGRKGIVLICKKNLLGWYSGFGFVNEGLSSSKYGGAVWYQMRLKF